VLAEILGRREKISRRSSLSHINCGRRTGKAVIGDKYACGTRGAFDLRKPLGCCVARRFRQAVLSAQQTFLRFPCSSLSYCLFPFLQVFCAGNPLPFVQPRRSIEPRRTALRTVGRNATREGATFVRKPRGGGWG
jgi:hypothetical protein